MYETRSLKAGQSVNLRTGEVEDAPVNPLAVLGLGQVTPKQVRQGLALNDLTALWVGLHLSR